MCDALEQMQPWLDEHRCIVGAVMHPTWGLVCLSSLQTLKQATPRQIHAMCHDNPATRVLFQLAGLRALTRMLDEQEAESE